MPNLRLTAVKVQGFKSFADTATFRTDGTLIGIVGPNGCGKSNIVDAVRWALGESRATMLRGGLLSDVLFVGSKRREASASCFVELQFSNDSKDSETMWGKYPKIAVRRELHRDGQQNYTINDTAVRRRDVVDLFRGTGVSPRAYGVVEQGMITRIADSAPEELRNFLEEAAGVSHYKERKRECEQRLQSGRDNLEQVAVILGSMQKQAESLRRQARKARRYREFTEQINALDALLISGRRAAAEARLAAFRSTMKTLEEKINEARKQLETLKTEGEKNNQHRDNAQSGVDAAQQAVTDGKAALAATDRDLQNADLGRKSAQQRLADSEKELNLLTTQTAALSEEGQQLEKREGTTQKSLDAGVGEQTKLAEKLTTLHDTQQQKQRDLEKVREELAKITQTLEAQKVRRQMLEERLAALQGRIAETEKNMAAITIEDISGEEPKDDEAQVADCQRVLAEKQQQNATLAEKAESSRSAVRTLESDSAVLTVEINTLQTMLKEDGWTNQQMPRLAEMLQVDAGDWARALDAALGAYAAAAVVEDIDQFIKDNDDLPPAAALVEIGQNFAGADEPSVHAAAQLPSLLSVLALPEKNKKILSGWLRGWYTAKTDALAAAARHQLQFGEYIVTPEGAVYGSGSLLSPGDETRGGYNWEQRMRDLSAAKQDKETALSAAIAAQQQALTEAKTAAAQVDEAATRLEAARQRLADRRIEWNRRQEQRRAMLVRQREFAESLEVMRGEHNELNQTQKTLAEQFSANNTDFKKAQKSFGTAQTALQGAEEKLQQCRAEVGTEEQKRRDLQSQLTQIKQQRQDITLRLREAGQRRHSLDERVKLHQQELSATEKETLQELQQQQQQQLETATDALAARRQNLRDSDERTRVLEKQRETAQNELEKSQQLISEERLNEREMTLTIAHCAEALEELALTAEQLTELQTAHAGETEQQWKADMETMRTKRDQLGAINFTADNELEECERKLAEQEAQKTDIETAINELYSTIQRIDRETQTKLQTIFDGINENFAPLFQKLFGGGEARLDMTGAGILDAVFELKVRPPGKRLIPIKMLSGGEKAAAALAFVFSILQINPPPFCLLDEVDAPLDDRRAERFAEMLKDIATTVQCLVITHNKSTIATMPRLIGVTQEEPGVSKVVSVELDENK